MRKDFEALETQYSNVRKAARRQFSEECSLLDELMAASFSFYYRLAGTGRLDEKKQHLAALFYRNCIYLSGAYQLVLKGMLDPAGNNMRTVFETIVWQYAYLTEEEAYHVFRELSGLEAEKISLLSKGEWSNTRERRLQNLRRKQSLQKAMKRLYSKDTYEKFFNNKYWILCQKSHSSLFGTNYNTPTMEGLGTMKKNPGEMRGMLLALLYLGAENLLCFLNCLSGDAPEGVRSAAVGLSNRINQKLGPEPSLVPDARQLEFTTRLREL
ncbi:hypothetical protein GF318_00265 [Candidatus Micrarchaeota archaeon]|nr:hypothetical protein [Candidatus Micrarchaeota archaeon]